MPYDRSFLNRLIAPMNPKQFRTWHANALLMAQLAKRDSGNGRRGRLDWYRKALHGVAEKMGHSRGVCEKNYIYPLLKEQILKGKLDPRRVSALCNRQKNKHFNRGENALRGFLLAFA